MKRSASHLRDIDTNAKRPCRTILRVDVPHIPRYTTPPDLVYKILYCLPHDVLVQILSHLYIDDVLQLYFTGDRHVQRIVHTCSALVHTTTSEKLELYAKYMDVLQLQTLHCELVHCRVFVDMDDPWHTRTTRPSKVITLNLDSTATELILTPIFTKNLLPHLRSLRLDGRCDILPCAVPLDWLQTLLPPTVTRLHFANYLLTVAEYTQQNKTPVTICFPHVQELSIVRCRLESLRLPPIVIALGAYVTDFVYHELAYSHLDTRPRIDYHSFGNHLKRVEITVAPTDSYIYTFEVVKILPHSLRLPPTVSKLVVSESQWDQLAELPAHLASLTIAASTSRGMMPLLKDCCVLDLKLPQHLVHLNLEKTKIMGVYNIALLPDTLQTLRASFKIQMDWMDVFGVPHWKLPRLLETFEAFTMDRRFQTLMDITPFEREQIDFLQLLYALPRLHTCIGVPIYADAWMAQSDTITTLTFPYELAEFKSDPVVLNLQHMAKLTRLHVRMPRMQPTLIFPASMTHLRLTCDHPSIGFLPSKRKSTSDWWDFIGALPYLRHLHVATETFVDITQLQRIIPTLPLEKLSVRWCGVKHVLPTIGSFEGRLPCTLEKFMFASDQYRYLQCDGSTVMDVPRTLQCLILFSNYTPNNDETFSFQRARFPKTCHVHEVKCARLECVMCTQDPFVQQFFDEFKYIYNDHGSCGLCKLQ